MYAKDFITDFSDNCPPLAVNIGIHIVVTLLDSYRHTPQLKQVETNMSKSSRDPLQRRINRIAGISSLLVYFNLIGAFCFFWAWLAAWENDAELFFLSTIAWPACLNGAFVCEVLACILLALGSVSDRDE